MPSTTTATTGALAEETTSRASSNAQVKDESWVQLAEDALLIGVVEGPGIEVDFVAFVDGDSGVATTWRLVRFSASQRATVQAALEALGTAPSVTA